MPKLKTHKGMSKRIKVTGSGKLLHRRAFRGHLLGGKQTSLKRTYSQEFQVSAGDESNVKRMIGNHK